MCLPPIVFVEIFRGTTGEGGVNSSIKVQLKFDIYFFLTFSFLLSLSLFFIGLCQRKREIANHLQVYGEACSDINSHQSALKS